MTAGSDDLGYGMGDQFISKIGLAGSPTKVKSVESIVLTANEAKVLNDSDSDIEGMIKELQQLHLRDSFI